MVLAASMPGRCAAPPAPAMMAREPPRRRVLGVFEQVVGHPVRRHHARLVAERRKRRAARRRAASRPSRCRCPSRRRPAACGLLLRHPRSRPSRGRFARRDSSIGIGPLGGAAQACRRALSHRYICCATSGESHDVIRHGGHRQLRHATVVSSHRRLALALFVLVAAWRRHRCKRQSDADFLAGEGRRTSAAIGAGSMRSRRALRGHVLGAVRAVLAAEARTSTTSTPTTVRAFLARYAATPLAERLRIDWLKALARRGDWSDFVAEDPPAVDRRLGARVRRAAIQAAARCRRSAARRAKPLWFTGQSTPDTCEPLFDAMFARGELTDADRRARLRLASEAGNVRSRRRSAAELPGARSASARRSSPRSTAIRCARSEGRVRLEDARAAASSRSMRSSAPRASDVGAARAAWVKLARSLPEADRQYGNRRLAYHAARQLDPARQRMVSRSRTPRRADRRASRGAYARRCAPAHGPTCSPPSTRCRRPTPRSRVALLEGARARGRRAAPTRPTASMRRWPATSASTACSPRKRSGSDRNASSRCAATARRDGAALAAFGTRAACGARSSSLELEMRARRSANGLRACVQSDESAAARGRVRASRRPVRPLDQHGRSHARAPRLHAALSDALSRPSSRRPRATRRVDEALLYGIARQESRFVADIVSSAGAVGLMQLMPAHGAVGGRSRWAAPTIARRTSPTSALNTQFGAFYFSYWLDRLDRCRRWRPPPTMRVPAARRPGGPRRAARRRDLGRDDPVQRDARLREESAGQLR